MTREEAIEILWQYDVNFEPHPAEKVMHAIDMAIEALQTEVVRCKNCRHRDLFSCPLADNDFQKDDDYCSWGERREE